MYLPRRDGQCLLPLWCLRAAAAATATATSARAGVAALAPETASRVDDGRPLTQVLIGTAVPWQIAILARQRVFGPTRTPAAALRVGMLLSVTPMRLQETDAHPLGAGEIRVQVLMLPDHRRGATMQDHRARHCGVLQTGHPRRGRTQIASRYVTKKTDTGPQADLYLRQHSWTLIGKQVELWRHAIGVHRAQIGTA